MEKFLARYSSYIYAVLRIVAGLMFMLHGTQKLFGFPGTRAPVPLDSLMGVAGVIETLGGLMIAIGFLAPYAAFLCSGEMAVAYFMAHFPRSIFPVINQGEAAVLYCFVFLYICSRGSGIWSMDSAIGRRPVRYYARAA